jgi:membrane protein
MYFIRDFIRKMNEDELFHMANGLTYRVLLAFFPFLVFLMSLLGFMNLDNSAALDGMYGMLPEDIYNLVTLFLAEVLPHRSTGLLSFSLLFTVYAVANGFRIVIFCINKSYNNTDRRGFVKKALISVLLMLIFAFALVVMLVLLIFGGNVWTLLKPYLPDAWESMYLLVSTVMSFSVLLVVTMLIYKLACACKQRLMDVLPGAGVTVLLWAATSGLFGFFVSNFTNYSRLYGSIAGVFILILWLDIISLILLLGNQLNAMLAGRKRTAK